jgi:hypothetical protein
MSNLLPQQHKISMLRLYRKRLIAVAFFALAFLAVASILLLSPSYLFLHAGEIVLTTKRDTLAGYETSKIATTLAGTVADINSRLRVFPDISPASPLIAGMIDPILKVKGPAVHIDSFDYTPGVTSIQAKIRVSGTADSRVDLLAFADKVRNIGNFTSVSVPITSFIKDSDVTFTLSAVVALKP